MKTAEHEARKLFKDLFSQFPQLTWAKWDMKRFPIILKAIQRAEQRGREEKNKDNDLEWFQIIESILNFHPISQTEALKKGIKVVKNLKRKGLIRAAEISEKITFDANVTAFWGKLKIAERKGIDEVGKFIAKTIRQEAKK